MKDVIAGLLSFSLIWVIVVTSLITRLIAKITPMERKQKQVIWGSLCFVLCAIVYPFLYAYPPHYSLTPAMQNMLKQILSGLGLYTQIH